MKIRLSFTITAITLLSVSCDDIAPDNRLIQLPSVDIKRTVLLEEYTGQMCANCPLAHEAAAELLKQYGDDLVIVGIHGGAFGMSEHYSIADGSFTCLATDEGDALHTSNDINSWPAAIINRLTPALNLDSWAAAVRSAMEQPSPIELSITESFNSDSTKLTAKIMLHPHSDVENSSLHVWILENDIDAFQQNGATMIDHYRHNHVYCGSLTPMPNGFNLPSLTGGIVPDPIEFSISLPAQGHRHWNPSKLKLAAFITTTASGVIQAATTH